METRTIEQTATVAEGGIAYNIGQIGQIHQISNYRVVGESHFYELNPDKLEMERFGEDPPRAEELAALLAEGRLLILAGELEDKSECARHIALRLFRRLEAAGRRAVIRERCRGKDPQRIETAFHEEKTTILLLTEISQSLIAGYGPTKLRHLLAERDGYAIVTTECTRAQWEIADGTVEARLWQELSWETYHGRDRLAGYLDRLLFNSDLEIPEGLVSEAQEGDLRVGGVPLGRAVEILKTPERIHSFVTSLAAGQTVPTSEGVEEKLAELAGDAAAIRQWYLQFNDRDQLLVVGLVLLDGLPDDLLFAGLEILVETTWRETDPLFSQFDYRDLSRFATYFKQIPIDGGFLRIESGSRKRRLDILQVAWNHQRRRLLATLPALTEMVRVAASEAAVQAEDRETKAERADSEELSAARAAAERALSRTKSGSMQLQQAVVESLSLIGLVSVDVVEPYLLDLATEPSESVRLLVARALGLWREANREEEFFSLLRRWWSEACNVSNPDSWISRATGLSPDPWAAVRATLALTVGFAAQYDRENRLAPELFGLLNVLIDDPHPRVREAVWKHALPRAVAWHLRQLDPFLRERVLVSQDFVQAVAWGAAEACEMRTSECLPILDAWWATARADSRHGSRRAVLPREALLATVAATYGFIRGSEDQPWMSSEVLVDKLRVMLTEEGHPFVRWYALHAVATQTRSDPELAAHFLPDLLTRLTLDDRPQVAALAVRCYLYQRQHLEGGDRKLELDGRSYAVWTDGTRPLTGIEAMLYGWLLDRSRPVAQQVAVASFAAIAATSLEREERRLIGERPQSAALQGGVGNASIPEPEVYSLNPFGHLAVVAATLGKEEVRPLLRPLMAQVVVQRQRHLTHLAQRLRQVRLAKKGQKTAAVAEEEKRAKVELDSERVEVLLARWGGVRNRSAQVLAGYLRRAVHFYNWRWGMVCVLALLLFGLAKLYLRAEQALIPPLEMLAEEVIPVPYALTDFMAPLPPGRQAENPLPFAYVIACVPLIVDSQPNPPVMYRSLVRVQPGLLPLPDEEQPLPSSNADQSVSIQCGIPRPFVLGEFSAPVPPSQVENIGYLRYIRKGAPPVGQTPMERAWAWRSKVLLMH